MVEVRTVQVPLCWKLKAASLNQQLACDDNPTPAILCLAGSIFSHLLSFIFTFVCIRKKNRGEIGDIVGRVLSSPYTHLIIDWSGEGSRWTIWRVGKTGVARGQWQWCCAWYYWTATAMATRLRQNSRSRNRRKTVSEGDASSSPRPRQPISCPYKLKHYSEWAVGSRIQACACRFTKKQRLQPW